MNRCILMIGLLLLVSVAAYAAETDTTTQTFKVGVDEIAAISTNGVAVTDLQIVSPAKGSGGPAPASQSSISNSRVRYTSVLVDIAKARKVTAGILALDGTVPAGCKLQVLAGADAAGGAGVCGTPTAIATLPEDNASSVDIITGIKSCYTGDVVATDGHLLTYTLSIDDWGTVKKALAADVTVTLTLTGEG